MKYLGSKARIAHELKPIIEQLLVENNREVYIEPFVGGANLIDKIDAPRKVGSDKNPYLIALHQYVQNLDSKLPKTITETEYINVRDNKNLYPDWYLGLVGFCATFSAVYFGGFARGMKEDGITARDMPKEAIQNIEKQRESIQNAEFIYADYTVHSDITNALIYCDPPYKGTDRYMTDALNYEAFYSWCVEMAKKGNTVLVSEYNMPTDLFEVIWEKGLSITVKETSEGESRVERLYKVKQ